MCSLRGAVKGRLAAISPSFWSLWGRSGSHFGVILGWSGGDLGAQGPKLLASGVLGALEVLWGSSGDHLGADLELSWAPIRAILGPPGAVLGPSWGHLGPSWGVLGRSWAVLGLPWGSWKGFGSHRGAVSANRKNHRKTIGFSTILASRGPS